MCKCYGFQGKTPQHKCQISRGVRGARKPAFSLWDKFSVSIFRMFSAIDWHSRGFKASKQVKTSHKASSKWYLTTESQKLWHEWSQWSLMLAQLIVWVCVFEFSLNAWSAAKYGTAPWEAWPSNGKLRPSDVISNNSFYRLPAIPWTFQLRCLGDWKSAADLTWQKPWNPCNACSFEQPSFRLMIFFAFSTSACLFCALAYTMSKMGNQQRTNANAWLRWRFKITSVHLDDLLQIVHRVGKDLDLSAAWHDEA